MLVMLEIIQLQTLKCLSHLFSPFSPFHSICHHFHHLFQRNSRNLNITIIFRLHSFYQQFFTLSAKTLYPARSCCHSVSSPEFITLFLFLFGYKFSGCLRSVFRVVELFLCDSFGIFARRGDGSGKTCQSERKR